MFEQSKIVYRDRPLKNGEKYHYYCRKCGTDIHPDFVNKHKCLSINSHFKKQNIYKKIR